MKQHFISKKEFIIRLRNEKVFLVCGKSFLDKQLYRDIHNNVKDLYTFTDFSPNPDIISVKKGIEQFNIFCGTCLIGVGGGSAIDVAKGIKAFVHYEDEGQIGQLISKENSLPLVAVPTTAGSGSESTHFAVIYQNGNKLSIANEYLLPSEVLLLPELLESLPKNQRKATYLDALSHSIESYWSVRSNETSKKIAKEAMCLCIKHRYGYIENIKEDNIGMLKASNLAGQAINITQTTAAHAMSYKLTTLYGLPHGYAVFLCLRELWSWMWESVNRDHNVGLKHVMMNIVKMLGCKSGNDVELFMEEILKSFDFKYPLMQKEDIEQLVSEVNLQRLNNHPISVKEEDLRRFYSNMLERRL